MGGRDLLLADTGFLGQVTSIAGRGDSLVFGAFGGVRRLYRTRA